MSLHVYHVFLVNWKNFHGFERSLIYGESKQELKWMLPIKRRQTERSGNETWFLRWLKGKVPFSNIPWKSTDSPASESTTGRQSSTSSKAWCSCHKIGFHSDTSATGKLRQSIYGGSQSLFESQRLAHTHIWNAGVDLFHWIPIPSKLFADVPKFCHYLSISFCSIVVFWLLQSVLGEARASFVQLLHLLRPQYVLVRSA